MTLQEEFDNYITSVYDDPPAKGGDQYLQLRDAFFGGCLTGLGEPPLKFAQEIRTWSDAKTVAAQVKWTSRVH